MPTTRRKAGGTTSARNSNQATLSFNAKSARVTKPTKDTPTGKQASKDFLEADLIEENTLSTPQPEAEPQKQAEAETEEISVAIRSSPAKPTPRKKKSVRTSSGSKDTREQQAEKVTDAQIKKYWKAEEDARLAPRVHQKDVSLHEKILRHFDLSSEYGPCIGIQRLIRWKRANGLGLSPPVEVLAVLLREEDIKTSQGCGKLAYIDELGGGRVGIVE